VALRVEWRGKDGKTLGGLTVPGVTGTVREWTRIRAVTDAIPKDAVSASLSCWAPKGCTGVAFWDDILVRPYYPRLVTAVAVDAYRHTTAGGLVTVRAGLNLAEWELEPDKVTAELSVRSGLGTLIATVPPAAVQATVAVFTLDATQLSPGVFQLTCEVRNPDGTKWGRAACNLVRVAALPNRMACIDGANRLLVGGEPFFPLGVRWDDVNPWLLDTYCKGPFNCIVLPGTRPAAQFDMLAARGLKTICTLQDFYAGSRNCPAGIGGEADERAAIEAIVLALKDKPNLLAWQVAHLSAPELLPRVAAHRAWVAELDPDRPTWIVPESAEGLPSFVSVAEVLGLATHPIPRGACGDVLRDARLAQAAGLGYRALWMVPQAFNWAAYTTDANEKKTFRAPTVDEMRSMAWQSITAGANGLIFWSWQDLWKMDRTVDEGGQALAREAFAERWRDLCLVGEEIRRYLPALMSLGPFVAPVEADFSPAVSYRLHGMDGETFLFAVNSRVEPTTGVLHFKEDLVVAVELGRADPPSRRGRLCLSFSPLEVKVLRLSIAPVTAAAALPPAPAAADEPVQQ
jgi:hypothetical protein